MKKKLRFRLYTLFALVISSISSQGITLCGIIALASRDEKLRIVGIIGSLTGFLLYFIIVILFLILLKKYLGSGK